MFKTTHWATPWLCGGLVAFVMACGSADTVTETPPTADTTVSDTQVPDSQTLETDTQSPEADTTAPTPRYTFPGEQVACSENSNFESLLPILNGGKTHPTGRGEQATAYDPCNRRIVLFGGNDYQPEECADFGPKRFNGDTWIYSVEYANWARLEPPSSPSARGRHQMTFDRSRKQILLFGGRFRPEGASGNYTLFNDLWAFDVNTDTWTQLPTMGDTPSARGNSAMLYDDINDRVLLFGGSTSPNGLSFAPQNDLYRLDLDTNTWTRIQSTSTNMPEARLFHGLAMDGPLNKLILYGGGDANAFVGPFINDVWSFDLSTETWELLWLPSASSPGPPARINPGMIEDRSRGRFVVFAGHDDTSIGHRNDVWSFDPSAALWTPINAGDTGTGVGCASFCNCPPDLVEVDMASPERRQYHSFVEIEGEEHAILFGGKGDCGYLDDTWRLSLVDHSWAEIEPAGQGEACKRSGQEGCTDLCY